MSRLLDPVPGLGASAYDLRNLVSFVMTAIGVNHRADDGCPTVETIYHHGLTELGADLRQLSESLEDEKHGKISAAIDRIHARLELINECAHVLAVVTAAEKKGGAA